jgi:ABC-type bacteriocin/lantibiotic exporter with double-glycine peptidase domain
MRQWVPRYPQTTKDRCAIAALQAVRGYWKRRSKEKELVVLAGTVESGAAEGRGTTAIGVAKTASAKGMQVRLTCAAGTMQWLGDPEEIDTDPKVQAWVQQAVQFNNSTEAWQWLRDTIRAEKPVITSINEHPGVNGGSLHSVVVVAVSTETVTVIDPEQEPLLRHIKTAQFLTAWEAVFYIAILLTDPST